MKVTEINIYPIKSTRRIALPQSEVLPRGLPWDRRWMLVDSEGRFVTARQHPRLAMSEAVRGTDTLNISVAGRADLRIPLAEPAAPSIPVTVWKDRCEAVPVDPAADAWFSDYLGIACRLVRMTDALVRPVNPDYGGPADQVSFADGFPLLLISEASLHDLNRRLATPVPMQRFRPNLVVDGERAYIIAPKGLKAGDTVVSGREAPIATGNCLPLRNIPLGSVIHCIEMKPGKGAQLARSAGTSVQLVAREGEHATLRLRSGEMRKVPARCRAVIGEVSNGEHNLRSLGKAGAKRWRGIRPTVRGVAMNPVDHPHGGGEGRTSGGRHPGSPWGMPTKGYKTRKNKRTDNMIVRRRGRK